MLNMIPRRQIVIFLFTFHAAKVLDPCFAASTPFVSYTADDVQKLENKIEKQILTYFQLLIDDSDDELNSLLSGSDDGNGNSGDNDVYTHHMSNNNNPASSSTQSIRSLPGGLRIRGLILDPNDKTNINLQSPMANARSIQNQESFLPYSSSGVNFNSNARMQSQMPGLNYNYQPMDGSGQYQMSGGLGGRVPNGEGDYIEFRGPGSFSGQREHNGMNGMQTPTIGGHIGDSGSSNGNSLGMRIPGMESISASTPGENDGMNGLGIPGMRRPQVEGSTMNQPEMRGPGMDVSSMGGPGMRRPGMEVSGMVGPGMRGQGMEVSGMGSPGMRGQGMDVSGMGGPGMRGQGMEVSGMGSPGMRGQGMDVFGMGGPGMRGQGMESPGMRGHEMEASGMGSPGMRGQGMDVFGMGGPGMRGQGIGGPGMRGQGMEVSGMGGSGMRGPRMGGLGMGGPGMGGPEMEGSGMGGPRMEGMGNQGMGGSGMRPSVMPRRPQGRLIGIAFPTLPLSMRRNNMNGMSNPTGMNSQQSQSTPSRTDSNMMSQNLPGSSSGSTEGPFRPGGPGISAQGQSSFPGNIISGESNTPAGKQASQSGQVLTDGSRSPLNMNWGGFGNNGGSGGAAGSWGLNSLWNGNFLRYFNPDVASSNQNEAELMSYQSSADQKVNNIPKPPGSTEMIQQNIDGEKKIVEQVPEVLENSATITKEAEKPADAATTNKQGRYRYMIVSGDNLPMLAQQKGLKLPPELSKKMSLSDDKQGTEVHSQNSPNTHVLRARSPQNYPRIGISPPIVTEMDRSERYLSDPVILPFSQQSEPSLISNKNGGISSAS